MITSNDLTVLLIVVIAGFLLGAPVLLFTALVTRWLRRRRPGNRLIVSLWLSTGWLALCLGLLGFALFAISMGDREPEPRATLWIVNESEDEILLVRPGYEQPTEDALRDAAMKRSLKKGTWTRLTLSTRRGEESSDGGCAFNDPVLARRAPGSSTDLELEVVHEWTRSDCTTQLDTWVAWTGTDLVPTSDRRPWSMPPSVIYCLLLVSPIVVAIWLGWYLDRRSSSRLPPPSSAPPSKAALGPQTPNH